MWDLERSTLLGIGDDNSKGEVMINLDAFSMLTKLTLVNKYGFCPAHNAYCSRNTTK